VILGQRWRGDHGQRDRYSDGELAWLHAVLLEGYGQR
jgi:hypothetical protein